MTTARRVQQGRAPRVPNHHRARRARAFASFMLWLAGPTLRRRYGRLEAKRLQHAVAREFVHLLPSLPDLGNRTPFSSIIVINGGIIALHRVLRARGGSAEDTMSICVALLDAVFARIPAPVRRSLGRMTFSRRGLRSYLRRDGIRSQRTDDPRDSVYRLLEHHDGWSLQFERCAVIQLYDDLGVPELRPYCSFFDAVYSSWLGMGLDATATIGSGCPTCTLRFRRGKATEVVVPLARLLDGGAACRNPSPS